MAAAVIGGCASPMVYRDAQSFNANPKLADEDRIYDARGHGREEHADPHAPDATWTAQRTYEYRGGRDPVTGRATTQM